MSDSSPEKRTWKKETGKGKGKGKNKGKGKKVVKKTSDQFVRVEEFRREGEKGIDILKRANDLSILLEPTGFYTAVATLQHTHREECVLKQYALAQRSKNHTWIKSVRRDARFDFPDKWIEENIPSLDGSKLPMPKKKKNSAGEYSSGPSRDIRLETDSGMTVYRANAADSANPELSVTEVESRSAASELSVTEVEPRSTESELSVTEVELRSTEPQLSTTEVEPQLEDQLDLVTVTSDVELLVTEVGSQLEERVEEPMDVKAESKMGIPAETPPSTSERVERPPSCETEDMSVETISDIIPSMTILPSETQSTGKKQLEALPAKKPHVSREPVRQSEPSTRKRSEVRIRSQTFHRSTSGSRQSNWERSQSTSRSTYRDQSRDDRERRQIKSSSNKTTFTVTLGTEPPFKKRAVDTGRSVRQETGHKRITCPIPSCNSTDKRLRRHVIEKHLPDAFTYMNATDDDIAIQVDAMRWLVRTVLGPNCSLVDAVVWVNHSGRIPYDAFISTDSYRVYETASRILGIRAPRKFIAHPVNSPAALLFWRCLLALLMECDPDQLRAFSRFPNVNLVESRERRTSETTARRDQPLVNEPSRPPVVEPSRTLIVEPSRTSAKVVEHEQEDSESDPGDLILLDEATGSGDDETAPHLELRDDLPNVFDSHFHLDRTSKKLWNVDTGFTVEDLLSYSFSRAVDYKPSTKVNVVGGVIIYSEPRSYPEVNFSIEGPWKVAVGVHPKHFDTLTVERSMVLKQLLQHPKVVALGECGLDRTIPTSKWMRQDEIFKRMLNLARADQPLILHLRGPQGDAYGQDVHARCREMMEMTCDPSQLIHVHCFKGTVEMVEMWLRKFPRTYFGVTAAAQSFDEAQIAGLRAIPKDKLLLETDSPYFPPGKAAVNTPAYIGDVGAYVVSHLDLRPSELHRVTLENGLALYGARE